MGSIALFTVRAAYEWDTNLVAFSIVEHEEDNIKYYYLCFRLRYCVIKSVGKYQEALTVA